MCATFFYTKFCQSCKTIEVSFRTKHKVGVIPQFQNKCEEPRSLPVSGGFAAQFDVTFLQYWHLWNGNWWLPGRWTGCTSDQITWSTELAISVGTVCLPHNAHSCCETLEPAAPRHLADQNCPHYPSCEYCIFGVMDKAGDSDLLGKMGAIGSSPFSTVNENCGEGKMASVSIHSAADGHLLFSCSDITKICF